MDTNKKAEEINSIHVYSETGRTDDFIVCTSKGEKLEGVRSVYFNIHPEEQTPYITVEFLFPKFGRPKPPVEQLREAISTGKIDKIYNIDKVDNDCDNCTDPECYATCKNESANVFVRGDVEWVEIVPATLQLQALEERIKDLEAQVEELQNENDELGEENSHLIQQLVEAPPIIDGINLDTHPGLVKSSDGTYTIDSAPVQIFSVKKDLVDEAADYAEVIEKKLKTDKTFANEVHQKIEAALKKYLQNGVDLS